MLEVSLPLRFPTSHSDDFDIYNQRDTFSDSADSFDDNDLSSSDIVIPSADENMPIIVQAFPAIAASSITTVPTAPTLSLRDKLIQIKKTEKANISKYTRDQYFKNLIDRSIDYDIDGNLIVSYLEQNGVTKDQIDSYNYMIEKQIPAIISNSVCRADLNTYFKFFNVKIVTSGIVPQQAREKGLSYLLKVTAQIGHFNNDGTIVKNSIPTKQIEIVEIPILIGSNYDNLKIRQYTETELLKYGECIFDPGAYVIYNGKEKIILQQEKLRANHVLIFKDKKSYVCQINCVTLKGSRTIKLQYNALCQSIRLNIQEFIGSNDSINVFQAFRLLEKKYDDHGECVTGQITVDEIIAYILEFVKPEWRSKVLISLQGTRCELLARDNNRDNKVDGDYYDVYTNNLYVTKNHKKQTTNNRILKGKEMDKYVDQVLAFFLFPNISPNDVHEEYDQLMLNESKKMLLGIMVARYAEFLAGLRPADDRDLWKNKRLVGSAFMIRQLFRTLWDKFVAKINESICKKKNIEPDHIASFVTNSTHNKISDELSTSFTSGKWGCSKQTKQDNVTDETDRGESVLSFTSQATKSTAQIKKKAKNPKARRVQPDQGSLICPVNCTNGETIGLTKFKALGCEVTIDTGEVTPLSYIENKKYSENDVLNYGAPIDTDIISLCVTKHHTDCCLINSRPLGWCNGKLLRLKLTNLRRGGRLHHSVGLIHIAEDSLFLICTDGDRIMSPFIVVDKYNVPTINHNDNQYRSFSELLDIGVIEWLDVLESNHHAIVCYSNNHLNDINGQKQMLVHTIRNMMDDLDDNYSDELAELIENEKLKLKRLLVKKYTHSSVNPNLSLGVAASTIPYIVHNPAPRNAFQAGMLMQAMASNHCNNNLHFPTTGRISMYPTMPICSTETQNVFGLNTLPTGNMVIVAILTDDCNEEDAVVIKKEALERGLFGYTVVFSYGTIVKKADTLTNSHKIEEKTYLPAEPLPGHKMENYAHLDENGIVRVGSPVVAGDCLVCKVRISSASARGTKGKKTNFSELEREDNSIYVERYQDGVIDTVLVTELDNGNIMINIKVARYGSPTKQDKVATTQAQKSTIGKIKCAKDMPYTAQGVTPDIIINPHALPKRMTIATIIEMITSKYGALAGELVNAASFKDKAGAIESYGQILKLFGYPADGSEKMYYQSGDEILTCNVMIGPIYYQLLKHQVMNKYQVRGTGQRDLIRRLPVQGRKKNGGGRAGEQEVFGMLAHGAPNMINNRTAGLCDPTKDILCQQCNNVATIDLTRGRVICHYCSKNNCEENCVYSVSNSVHTFNVFAYFAATLGIKVGHIFSDDKVEMIEEAVAVVDPDLDFDDEEIFEEEEEELDGLEGEEDGLDGEEDNDYI